MFLGKIRVGVWLKMKFGRLLDGYDSVYCIFLGLLYFLFSGWLVVFCNGW